MILFDEPLSNLDAALRVQMRAELQKLHQELSPTIVYVTHDQVEAMTMANSIVVLNQGEVAQWAAPIELYRHPDSTFVATFIGSPRMNLVAGPVERRTARPAFEATAGGVPLAAAISAHRTANRDARHPPRGHRPVDPRTRATLPPRSRSSSGWAPRLTSMFDRAPIPSWSAFRAICRPSPATRCISR